MPVGVRYEIEGGASVEAHLLGMEERALDPVPVLEGFADKLRDIEQELFEGEGHGTWAPLAESTVERKGNDRILVETEALMDSLTKKDDPAHFEIITGGGDELIFGTSDPKATLHRDGTRNMPARDPLQVGPEDIREFTRELQAYLIGVERATFGAPSFGLASLGFG